MKILSLDELAEIEVRHDDFMYPSPNEFGIKEQDVERLIYTVRKQDQCIQNLIYYLNDIAEDDSLANDAVTLAGIAQKALDEYNNKIR